MDVTADRALRIVRGMLDRTEQKIDAEFKCSVADTIRLLQLERELMAEQQVKEIQVRWTEKKKDAE